MATRIFIKNNYITVDIEGDNDHINDHKSRVFINPIDTAEGSYLIESEKIGRREVLLSDLTDEAGTPYNLTTWTSFFTENTGFDSAPFSGARVEVLKVSDLPTPINGVITLKENVTYIFLNDLDLNGLRLLGSSDTVILGESSENCSITSTGLDNGIALFTTEWTTPIRHITFEHAGKVLDINGVTNSPVALDWTGVNFLNCPNVGIIDSCDNWVFTKGAFLNSKGLVFTGTIGSAAGESSILVGDGLAGNIIELDANCVITRRFRFIYGPFVVFGSTVGINVNISAIIPTESYILDTISFSGGGTYLSGVGSTSNKSLFKSCDGITNTTVNGQIYMQDNITPTVLALADTFYKISGTTTASADNQKYTATDNRLTCNATISRKYLIQCNLSFQSGNNKICQFGFYDSKLGAIRQPSKTKSTSNGSGRAENVSFNCVVNHESPNFLEIHCLGVGHSDNITVTDMNFVVTEII